MSALLSTATRVSRLHTLLFTLGALLVMRAATPVTSVPSSADSIELGIKAAYLFNFAKYVYWPQRRPGEDANLVFGVLGRDPILTALEQTVSRKTINGRQIRVRQFNSVEQIDTCNVLFVPRAESKRLPALLEAVAGKPILTVSDKENFARDGGSIEFLFVDDTVRFAINNEAAERTGLKLNSELLRLAYAVNGKRKRPPD